MPNEEKELKKDGNAVLAAVKFKYNGLNIIT